MSQQFTKAIGGITPLGVFTITPGVPQKITANLALSDKTFTLTARQIGFSVESAPSGQVFVNYGNVAGADAHATALIVPSGTATSLPIGCETQDGLIDVTQWWIDGSAACVVAVYVMDASS